MYYVYIIQSESTGKWYYGYTERILERIIEHNNHNGKYTDGKGPWTLIFQREFDDKAEALRFEKELKRLKNKNYIQRAYARYFINNN